MGSGNAPAREMRQILKMLDLMERFSVMREYGERKRRRRRGEAAAGNAAGPQAGQGDRHDLADPGSSLPRLRRMHFDAEVLIEKQSRLTSGVARNISGSGIFVEAEDGFFRHQEVVRLWIRPDGVSAGYRVLASVARIGRTSDGRMGYGLKFCRA